jgi:TonB family protein
MVNINYENSPLRWFVSSIIAVVIILLFLILMIRESRKTPLYQGPLMELDYVVVQTTAVKEEKKITRVQTKKVQQEQVPEKPPEEKTIETPEIMDAPAQSAEIPHTEPSTAAAQVETGKGPHVSTPVKRIEVIAELDNTEFEPLYNPKPDYPVVAQVSQITGYVDVDLVISEQGKVESFTIVKTRGHPSFAIETAKVLSRWRFPPPRIGGKKVRVQYTYRVKFTLN